MKLFAIILRTVKWTTTAVFAWALHCLIVPDFGMAGKDIEFNSDPGQEDFERIMQPLINPIRQTEAAQPGIDGSKSTFSYTQTHVPISEEADNLSRGYFTGGHVGSSMDITRFNLHIYDRKENDKGKFHSGLMLTFGSLPFSNQQLFGGSAIFGSEFMTGRLGYSTLYGSDEFAACAINGEIVVQVFRLERIVSVYGGGGASKAGVAAWWQGMPEERRRVWFDRYGIVGFNLPVGSFITNTDYSPISVGGEVQYSTSPKQMLATLKLAFSW